jgi:hypothetical protein
MQALVTNPFTKPRLAPPVGESYQFGSNPRASGS